MDISAGGNDVDYGEPTNNIDDEADDEAEDDVVPNLEPGSLGVRVVRKLSQTYFRERLVEHFEIRFQQHTLVWPKRNPGESA